LEEYRQTPEYAGYDEIDTLGNVLPDGKQKE
jgi:hypothetical protein